MSIFLPLPPFVTSMTSHVSARDMVRLPAYRCHSFRESRPESLSLADSHAHLADPALRSTVEEVVARANAAGVTRMLAVGTDLSTSAQCIELASRFSSVFAAVGIHPHDAANFDLAALAELRRLAALPKVVAIGEIGLDYVRSTASPAVQQVVFVHQIALAAEVGLPVVIHNRGADADVLRLISGVKKPVGLAGRAGVLHCFGGNIDLARQARDVDFSISFAGNLTYRRSVDLRDVAAGVPLSWLLIETDCPHLSPEPKRGKVNEPENVAYVARELASIRRLPPEDVAVETSANAAALFAWN